MKLLLIVSSSILIVLLCERALTNGQKCKKCVPKNFIQKSQACICPENQFCEKFNNTCSKCDACYDHYNDKINQSRADIGKILKRFDIYLSQLEKLIKTLVTNVKKRESELVKLDNISGQVTTKITKITNDIGKLKQDVRTAEEKLKQMGKIKAIDEVLKELDTIKEKMKELLEKLTNLKFGDDDDDYTFDWNRIQKLNDSIKNLGNKFPVDTDPLSLAAAIESDIELLESIISKFDDKHWTNQIPGKLKEDTRWIEKDLLWLFTILNNYGNVSIDVDKLQKNASIVSTIANSTDLKLAKLLEKFENFKKLNETLHKEVKFYDEIKRLRQQLANIGAKIRNFINNIAQIQNRLNVKVKEFREFKKKREEFDKKELKISKNKKRMEELLKEEKQLLEKLEKLENKQTIDKMEQEIDRLRKEIIIIIEEVTTHCHRPAPKLK